MQQQLAVQVSDWMKPYIHQSMRRVLTSTYRSRVEEGVVAAISRRKDAVVTMIRLSESSKNALWTAACTLFLSSFVLFGQSRAVTQSQGSALCKTLPSDIQHRLGQQFDSWRVQEAKDLSATARERWQSEKPKACPGIAEGRFAGGTALSYAVLLVPSSHPDGGYKFLVFSPSHGKGSYELTIVEQSNHGGAGNYFIHCVRISKFFDERSRRKFGVKTTEGILLVDAGAKEYETDVYFWVSGGYQHQPVDY